MILPPEVLREFASCLINVEWQMADFEQEKPDTVVQAVRAAMLSIPESAILNHMQNPMFQFANGERSTSDQHERARRDLIGAEIAREITLIRNRLLYNACTHDRPEPYDHTAIKGLPIA